MGREGSLQALCVSLGKTQFTNIEWLPKRNKSESESEIIVYVSKILQKRVPSFVFLHFSSTPRYLGFGPLPRRSSIAEMTEKLNSNDQAQYEETMKATIIGESSYGCRYLHRMSNIYNSSGLRNLRSRLQQGSQIRRHHRLRKRRRQSRHRRRLAHCLSGYQILQLEASSTNRKVSECRWSVSVAEAYVAREDGRSHGLVVHIVSQLYDSLIMSREEG